MRVSNLGTAGTWKRSVGELTLIVIGVLIALAANSWWEGRKDRARERAYLERLLSDMRENERRLQEAIAEDSAYVAENERFLDVALADGAPTPNDSVGLIDILRAEFEPLIGTYTALVQSGDLHQIRNEAVRLELISYAARLSDAQENLRQLATRSWRNVEVTIERRRSHLQPLGNEDGLPPERWRQRVDLEAMLRDPQLVSAMETEWVVGDNRLFFLRRLRQPTRTLTCLLTAELESVEAVELRPASASIRIGETTGLAATVRFSNDLMLDGCPVSWATDDEDIASVDEPAEHPGALLVGGEKGVASINGVAQGEVMIEATFDGVSASAHISVEPES